MSMAELETALKNAASIGEMAKYDLSDMGRFDHGTQGIDRRGGRD